MVCIKNAPAGRLRTFLFHRTTPINPNNYQIHRNAATIIHIYSRFVNKIPYYAIFILIVELSFMEQNNPERLYFYNPPGLFLRLDTFTFIYVNSDFTG